MLSGKQRATLRSVASTENTIFQIGKDGITDGVINSCDSALTAREIIKISVLKSSPVAPREAGELLAKSLKAEFIAAIGSKVILYRFSNNKTEHVKF